MDYKQLLDWIISRQKVNAAAIGTEFPYNDTGEGFKTERLSAWTNGFYPGLMWISFLASGENVFRETAEALEERLAETITECALPGHDVGFVWLLSSGIHYAVDKNGTSRARLLFMADYLAGRYNIKGRYIRAWDSEDGNKIVPGLAIIDCMMNLPLLFLATKISGDPRYAHIARAHADTALKCFIDKTGAVRHICRFDPEDGRFIEALGGQGYSGKSAWSRGAAWAIYGFAMAYRYTRDKRYLDASRHTAEFFMSQLGDDGVPAWDFRAPNNDIKDSSAGAIAACGMLELYSHTAEDEYKAFAVRLVTALVSSCRMDDNRQALLGRATANLPGNENIEVGLIYGDYYFAEAVFKLAKGKYELPWEINN